MSTLRTAAQQALEALDWMRLHLQRDHQCLHMDPAQSGIPAWINKAEITLRAALAEPVQEPVAWRWGYRSVTTGEMDWRGYVEIAADPNLRSPEIIMQPLYTAPSQRKPLTDEEIDELLRTMGLGKWSVNWLCRAVEKAHGIE